MRNKELIQLYNLNKLGLQNTLTKKCLCGEEMGIDEKECPKCKEVLPKGKLLNVNKNNALAKRSEFKMENDIYTFRTLQLLSNGYELYESETLSYSMDTKSSEVKISNTKIFKTAGANKDFLDALETCFPGFYNYILSGLAEFRYEYAISNFTSMSESQISNYFHVYQNYKALIPYLKKYKVFYYGNKVNLNNYFPGVDFNNIDSVEKSGLCLKLLTMWDIKNEKYIESIINLSKSSNEELETLENIVNIMTAAATRGRYSLEYNDIIESFSLLFNKEISLEDFIRIYNNSPEDFFVQLSKFRQLYKKSVNKVIDWSSIDKIDRRILGSLECKQSLSKECKIQKKDIENIYEILEKNPLEALKKVAALKVKDN